ncbi:ribonuclease H-like domain-containing protein [Tanacetum coccineum]
MVEGDKPPKNKGVSSSSEEDNIDQYDPLFLHSNDTNGVPIIGFKLKERPEEAGFMQEQWDMCNSVVLNWILRCVSQDVFMRQFFCKIAKVVWDKLEETYSKQDALVIFNVHYKIHSLSRSGSALSEYYDKFNALWRKYDSLVDLLDCICENSEKLKKHNQLLKLMQFLIGLVKIYAPIRSIILTTNPIPDVKCAFPTLSRDESHRSTQSHSVSKIGNGNSTFMARTNNISNNWSNSNNNQNKRLNRPNLLCTHCNMNGHTADRCFELVGYPPNFKKRNGSNQGGSSNATTLGTKDQSSVSSNTFTDEQFKRLMDLISEKSGFNNIPANVAGHPNRTKAIVTYIGSLKLTDKITINDVLVVPDYQCIWHNRLGRPSDQVLSFLKHRLKFDHDSKNELFEVCHKAKQNRETFPISEHKTNDLGQIVHLDVWGPYKVQSRNDFKYFLTIVDDFTRAIWVFLLRGKDEVSEKPVFVGYSFDKKGYKLYSLESKKMFYSRDVKFYETMFPFKHSSECKEYEMVYQKNDNLNFFDLEDNYNSEDPYDDGRDKESDISEGINLTPSEGTEKTNDTRRDEGDHPDDSASVEATGGVEENATPEKNDKESEGDDSFYQEFNENFQPTNDIPIRQDNVNLRRSSRKVGMPAKLSDFHIDTKVKYNIDKHVNYSKLSHENYSFSTNINKIYEPNSYNEAFSDNRWVEAMNLEMEALNKNNTWVITDLPPGRKVIGGKWVFKVKYKLIGDVERFKARCILSLSVLYDWPIFQLDINNAFLYGDLVEDVYMSLPEGYLDKDDKRVCKLVKSLYGLKQSLMKWN